MSLKKRIKTLWRLSSLDLTEDKIVVGNKNGELTFTKEPVYKQAQIIKRSSPVQEFLNKNKDE